MVWLRLQYQRLVGAGRVRRRRRRALRWQRADAARRRAVAGSVRAAAPAPAPVPPVRPSRKRCAPARLGVVLDAPHKRVRRPVGVAAAAGREVRKRRHDGQLAYGERAYGELTRWIGGARREPFGDG